MEQSSQSRKRRVALIGPQILLGEGLETILRGMQDVELLGPWELTPQVIAEISTCHPDLVLIAAREPEEDAFHTLIAQIIEQCPELPVIRVGLSRHVFQVFTMRTSPARSQELMTLIRSLPDNRPPGNGGENTHID
jgi:chemotaxis response regulator CheB